jgi:putative ABC transport system permease protein
MRGALSSFGNLTGLPAATPGGDFGPVTTVPPADFAEWRRESRTVESLEALTFGFYPVIEGTSPTEVLGGRVTPGFFSSIGVQPLIGRTFAAGDPEDVVVLGYKLWESQYGADRSIVGRRILLGNRNYTVLGVLPPQFFFYLREFALWTPLQTRPNDRAGRPVMAVGLLRPGRTVAEAQAEFDAIASRLEHASPATNKNRGARAIGLRKQYSRFFRPTLTLLLASAGFLILIGCANVAGLLLARTAGREKEMAVRVALGATRGQIARQLLADGLVLAIVAGVAGVAGAVILVPAARAVLPMNLPIPLPGVEEIAVSVPVLLCSAAVSIATLLLFGLAPALRCSRAGLNNRSASPGMAQARILDGIVVTELAVSVLLLTLAGVTGRTVFAMYHRLGFRSDHVLTFRTPVGRVPPAVLVRFFSDVLERAKALPGVRGVAAAYWSPGSGAGGQSAIFVKGGTEPRGRARAATNVVSGEFFEVLDIPLISGRTFSSEDRTESPVTILSASLARKLFPNEDPAGRLVRIDGQPPDRWLSVVGVAGDVRPMVSQDPVPVIYQPYTQDPPGAIGFVVTTFGPPLAIAPTIERAVWQIRPGQPITYVGTLENDLDEQGFRERLSAIGAGWFAGCGLVLACVGLYGCIAYVVRQRVKEFGIRLAVGATANDVVALVLRRGASLIALGLLIGMTAAGALTRVLEGVLYGVNTVDPLALAAAASLLAVTGLLACYIPSRKAAGTDPIEILRSE